MPEVTGEVTLKGRCPHCGKIVELTGEATLEFDFADYAPENWQPAQIAWVRNHPAFLLGLKQTLHANRLIPNLLKSLAFTGTFAQYIQQPEIEKEIVTSLLQRSAKPEKARAWQKISKPGSPLKTLFGGRWRIDP